MGQRDFDIQQTFTPQVNPKTEPEDLCKRMVDLSGDPQKFDA